jgi:hypothetical protein
VVHETDEIEWDKERKGVGRASWRVGYFLPSGDSTARRLVPDLNEAMAHWQARYDLRLYCQVN